MIQEFVDRFMGKKEQLEKKFSTHPNDYKDIVHAVVEVIGDKKGYCQPDPSRIHEINDGGYQGTLVYVIGAAGYQPSTYWYVKVGYGSCSVCDTLEAIKYRGEPTSESPTQEQVKDYMTLALHIVQGIKEMNGEAV